MPSSTYFSGGASDWTEHIKDYSTTQDGISLWDQVLTGLQQNLELQTQAVQASTDYDISQAYANYLQNQRQISQASNLGTGFKEQLESNLQSSYQSAFQQAQVNETQELYNVAQAYQDELTNVENQFAEMGETAAGYAGRLFEYAGQYGKYVPGYENIDWSGDLQAQGIYVQDDQGNLVLSEKGKDALSYLLLERVSVPGATEADATSTSFEQWLGETYSDELSGFREYADILRSGFGIEPGTTARTEDESKWRTRAVDLLDYFEGEVPEFDSYEEQYNYLLDTGLRVENASEKLNTLQNTLNTLVVRQPVSSDFSRIYIDDPEALKTQFADIGIFEDNISFYPKRGRNGKGYFVITISDDYLNDMKKHILEQSGFTVGKDGSFTLEIQSNAKEKDVNDFFRR